MTHGNNHRWPELTEEEARQIAESVGEELTREVALDLLRGGHHGVVAWNGLNYKLRHDVVISTADERADLERAHLQGVDLSWARLDGAKLNFARLEERATLQCAHLEGAMLVGAHLEGTNLNGAKLKRACIWEGYLEGADLSAARLDGADLRWAHLEETDISGADLTGSDLLEMTFTLAETPTLRGWVARKFAWQKEVNHAPTKVDGVRIDADSLATNPAFRRHVESQRAEDDARSREKFVRALMWTTDYGRSPGRFVAVTLGIMIAFGILFSPPPDFFPDWWPRVFGFRETPNSPFSPFYFSIVTFTAFGFGDFTPANWPTDVAVAAEVILGYVMLGLLLALLARILIR